MYCCIAIIKGVNSFGKISEILGWFSRNINWQEDWKHTSFVIFICFNKNIWRQSAMGGDSFVADVVENIRLNSYFKVLFCYAINIKYFWRMNVLYKIRSDTIRCTLHLIVTQGFIELKWLSICKINVKKNWIKTELWNLSFKPRSW